MSARLDMGGREKVFAKQTPGGRGACCFCRARLAAARGFLEMVRTSVRLGGPVSLPGRRPAFDHLVFCLAAALCLEACEVRSASEDGSRGGQGVDGEVVAPDLGKAQDDAGDPWEGGLPRAEADGSADAIACPAPHADPIPAGGSCDAAITQCGGPDKASPDCLGGSLRAVLARRITECGLYCGDLDVGFNAGCAAQVRWNLAMTSASTTPTTAKLCLEETLFGSRFDCTPTDGWQRLFLGSCTLL